MLYFIFRIMFFVLLNVAILYQLAVADEAECKECHQDVYAEISTYAFKHYDNLINECKGCHFSVRGGGYKKEDKWESVSLADYGREHLALLKNLSMDSTYQIKVNLMDKRGREKESDTLSFIPNTISEFLTDDEIPPVISMVEVKQVGHTAISASAEIRFETDEFSDSTVEYGTTEDYGKSVYSGLPNKRHAVSLNGLDHKKVYHYRVISSDLFGNRRVSKDNTFDTTKAFSHISGEEKQKEDDNAKPDFQTIRILKLKPKEDKLKESLKDAVKRAAMDDIVAVYFTASTETASVVEYMKKGGESNYEKKKHGEGGLKSLLETGINTCVERCHDRRVAHPVNVAVGRNMRAPDELPVVDGKIIICATCHLPHGSKLRHLARMDFNKLCVLCHTDR
ncbi:MAG: hypothetical protein HZA00_09130 [Nitrospinae bacterium]|nr:hypothetical protein [Nitrospinota bacterium]